LALTASLCCLGVFRIDMVGSANLVALEGSAELARNKS
jgi:hypothetical protein